MRLGLIGLGAMGLPIAKRLIGAFHKLAVFDLSQQAVHSATEAGAIAYESPRAVAAQSEILLFSLPNAAIVESVLNEIIFEGNKVKTVIDLSSISPESARNFSKICSESKITYWDCPVSGGVGGADAGTLTVMVGGPNDALEEIRPVLECFGKNIFYIGSNGAGSGIKMINNYLLGCNMAAVAEALVMASKIGIKLDTVAEIVGTSSGRSFIIENKIPNFIQKRQFDGGFAIDLEYKDLGLALETAKSLKQPVPMGTIASQVFEMARSMGMGKNDISALVKLWENITDSTVE